MTSGRPDTNAIQTICGICPAGCWVTADLVSGRLGGVRAQSDHPLGAVCPLGENSKRIVYSPHRLKRPLRRVGPKGSYRFKPISWDEAFETIAGRLERSKAKYGAESTAIYTGRGSFDQALCDVFQPRDTAVSSASSVLFPFGSPNTFGVGALCYVSFAMLAPHMTMGGMLINMDSELERAELIVVWGSNPATDCPPITHDQILAARAAGAEVVVIDPRRTDTAKAAGAEWVPVRPGTDGALALGMIHVLIAEDLYDAEFAEGWTIGFDDLKDYVQHFTPDFTAETTGVPAETIRRLAARIASARGAAPIMYTGLEYSDSGVQAIRATQILWALAGQLDVPGGRVFKMRTGAFPINKDGLIANPDPGRAIGRDRFPIYSQYRGESHAIALPEAVLEERPYPIKSLIILGGSMITAWPQPHIWRKTLAALDFLVTIDRQFTADAAYADIVLPATTGYENTSYMVYGPLFRIRERLIEPLGEARNDFFIMAELAARLGYGHLFPQTEDALLDHVLKNSGHTAGSVRAAGGAVGVETGLMEYKKWEKGLLRPDGKTGFNTPSGKFEIASNILLENGYDPLPVYTEPKEGPLADPALFQTFPLVFNSGARVANDFRSQHHGVKSLSDATPGPRVTLNAEDARVRGIKSGDAVFLSTARGKVRFTALVTDDIVAGAVDANMGGGGPVGPKAWRKSNVNELTDISGYDPISGFPVYKALLCEVELAAAGSEIPALEEAPASATATGPAVAPPPAPAKRIRAVYLDHNATTPLDPEALAAMEPWLTGRFGNPSSIHSLGAEARDGVEAARRVIARALNTTARRIIFTGGGSEADNLAVKGVARANSGRGRHIITSGIEHAAVLGACRALEKEGFLVTYLPVDERGLVDPSALRNAIGPETILVSIMTANNETGAVQPISDLAALARERGVLFHTDAVQAFGKLNVDPRSNGVDLLSISSHKIYGPKGIGALFVRQGVELAPLVDGGNQEGRLRAGTENVAAIAGFAKAADLAITRLSEMARIEKMRDKLEEMIVKIAPTVKINSPAGNRLPNTLNATLPGYRGESLVFTLDRVGIALSSGSACKSGSPEPSHALIAMGLTQAEAHCALRFSLGRNNTFEEMDFVAASLGKIINESSSHVRFVPCR